MSGLTVGSRRICGECGDRKDFYAEMCRRCRVRLGLYAAPLKGRSGADHPAWKGGTATDRDGYVLTYAPDHPWPRRGGYVREHDRVMELEIGRRITPDESVHLIDHDKANNDLSNLRLMRRGDHSAEHRRADTHLRKRSQGRFA